MNENVVIRVFENDDIIIYKRLFDLKNCGGDKRYFEVNKHTEQTTGKQFKSITQVRKHIKGSYYIIWIEGMCAKRGEKIRRFSNSGIDYTLKMTKAMRILSKDIPAMKEKLTEMGIADWVINSGNTFVKTSYVPKGTLFNF